MSRDEILDIFAIASGDKYIEFKDLPEIWNREELEFQLSMGVVGVEDLSVEMVECTPPCKFNVDREFLLTFYMGGIGHIYKHEDVFIVGDSYNLLLERIQNWVKSESKYYVSDIWSYDYDEEYGDL